ncbi:MAG TPA: ATP-binding protein [Solirubrobacteraceae bacterium]|nr:ATP-binding protein [Solirubrobacteraceae bacterium]
MKRREAVLALCGAGLVVLALLAVFAIELANTQAKSRQDVEARVHERGVLAGALIDSLFSSVRQQLPQEARTYGTRTVTAATLNAAQAQAHDAYLAVLGSNGKVIAHSSGFTPQAQTSIAAAPAVPATSSGFGYALGNLVPYGNAAAIELVFEFPTRYGTRRLVTGFAPRQLGTFITADLLKIPGVTGARNYLLDGNSTVLASTNPAVAVGTRFGAPAARTALRHSSADVGGQYYDQVRLSNSTWRIVLAAPNGPLFAIVSGPRKWVPWLIFICFALFALAALALGRRALRSAEEVREANSRLALVNTELASSNEALEHRARELARSNAELEQFASIASHDLQEPLRKVRTFTQQLTVIEAERLSDRGRDYLERANGAAERMQKLIEDLLKFSRVATHGRPFAPVDLAEVTHEVIDDLEAQLERSGAVIHTGALPTISADALQMRQLMQNLISNAVKFRGDGVTPEVWIEATTGESRARITVRDNGIGFEPQYARRIFRVFERLHGRGDYPGTGIGLALCRRIAERHGGTIVADSELGEGATFTVTLPMRQREEVLVLATYDEDGESAKPDAEENAHVTA